MVGGRGSPRARVSHVPRRWDGFQLSKVGGTLRLPSLVWEAYTGGAVLVFANLARAEYLKLREFLGHFA